MDAWETAANVATVAQAVVLPISLGLVAYQLRLQARFTRAANTQALVELSSPFNLLLIQDREFAELWLMGASEFERMDEVTRCRFRSLVTWWMMFHENVFYQHRRELIDDATWQAWSGELHRFVNKVDLAKHWPEFRDALHPAFVEHVDSLTRSGGGRRSR